MALGVSYFVLLLPLDAAGHTVSLAYSTDGYVVAPPFGWGGPVGSYVTGALKSAGVARFDLFTQGKSYGSTAYSTGEITLENTKGTLDSLRAYNFENCLAQLYMVFPGMTAGQDNAQQAQWEGYMGQPEFDEGEVRIPVRDASSTLDVPVQSRRFGGTNSLPNGLDGTPNDIAGKPLPICLGIVRNGIQTCVNTDRQIHQIHDAAFVNAYDGTPWSYTPKDEGAALGAGVSRTLAEFNAGSTDYTISSVDTATDQITLTASFASASGEPVHCWTTSGTMPAPLAQGQYYFARALGGAVISLHPTAADAVANTAKVNLTTTGSGTLHVSVNKTPFGLYDWCNDATGFYDRWGSSAVGAKSFAARSNVYSSFAPSGVDFRYVLNSVFQRLTPAAGFFSENISASNKDVNLYLTEDITARDLAIQFGQSFGGGLVSGGYLYSPDDPAAAVTQQLDLTASDIKAISMGNTSDDWGESVVWRVNYNYRRNHAVQDKTQIPGATDAEVAFAQQEWRTVTVSDASVKTQYPKARELTVYSVFDDPTTASTIATQLLTRFKVRRFLFKVTVPLKVDQVFGHQLAVSQVVRIAYPRFGLDAGVRTICLGIQRNFDAQTMDLVLWK